MENSTQKKPMGFAAMSPERQREIARMGGRAVKPESRSFSKDRNLARSAGRLGGQAVPAEKRTFSYLDREIVSATGRKGGLAVPAEKRAFSQDPELAKRAGRKRHNLNQ